MFQSPSTLLVMSPPSNVITSCVPSAERTAPGPVEVTTSWVLSKATVTTTLVETKDPPPTPISGRSVRRSS